MTEPGRVQVPTPVELALIDAYLEAIKKSVTAIDSAAEKTLTASFSIATAYGALIGLVAPKDEPNGFLVALPFGLTALAAVTAMGALSFGVRLKKDLTSDTLNSFKTLRHQKRLLNFVALAVLALAIGSAAWVVLTGYGPRSDAIEAGTVIVDAPASGVSAITAACPDANGSVFGEVHTETLEDSFVVVDVAEGECQAGTAVTLQLPTDQIQAIEIAEDTSEDDDG